ncbi:MAG: T9SS type A sorting domain-containing protein [Bacteroidetes bacterium]|nr:T9SS type A sorting domain-containing protein [Bacteroidota bacterium]
MKRFLATILCSFLVSGLTAQMPVKHKLKIQKINVFNPREVGPDFNAQVRSMEAPLPGGKSYKSFLMRQKQELRERLQNGTLRPSAPSGAKSNAIPPQVGRSFGMQRTLTSGTQVDITGGIPSDNTMAVSNDGILVAAINSLVYAYDLDADSALFGSNATISLRTIASGSGIENPYFDPKIIYDERADRFILVFLQYSDPERNGYIVAFSSTPNPADPWNVYFVTGNPLDNERWTDFPAISLVDNTLYITGNLIIDTAPTWQEGFDGSIIWQIPTSAGYAGEDEINPILYSDIRFDGRYIRNLHPVQGARGQAEEAFFMSNRNFDIQNDTMFVLHLHRDAGGDTLLDIRYTRTDVPYGMPPNGRQADTDTSDPTNGLQTNDARVLGALLHEGEIRFVANTVNTATGFAAIYLGKVQNPESDPVITGQILGDPELDFGYPNIAFSGNETCDTEWMVGFNYTSPDSFPGVACTYIDNQGNIADITILKAGENNVDRLSGGYERWGDYFGMQSRFNQPGTIYTTGYYALYSRKNGTWISELFSPDTSKIYISAEPGGSAGACAGTFTVTTYNASEPVEYFWNGTSGGSVYNTACAGDSVFLTVRDARGCSASLELVANASAPQGVIFPNPVLDQMYLQFTLEQASLLKAEIFDVSGRLVAELIQTQAKQGLNELQFNLFPLAQGVYFVRLTADGKEILSERLVKSDI